MKVLEIAVKYGVDPRTVYTWIEKGCPRHHEFKSPLRSVVRLDPDEVQAWLESRSAAGVQKVEAGEATPMTPPQAGAKMERKLTPWEERKVKEIMRDIGCSREEAIKYVERMAKWKGGEA